MRRVLLGLSCLLAPAIASAQSAAGRWQCTRSNYGPSTTSRFTQNFELALYPNGSFQLQGTQFVESAGYTTAFQAQGQWRQRERVVDVQGSSVQQDENHSRTFGFSATLTGPRSMSFRMNNPATGRFVVSCQR